MNQDIIKKYQQIQSKYGLLPIKVTPYYQKKIDEEIAVIGENGPLYKIGYPTLQRLFLKAPCEVKDFVNDEKNMPLGLSDIAVQKYEDRLLFFPTNVCFGHCQYCFRTGVLSDELKRSLLLPKIETKLKAAINYINEHPLINEIIFSGGDPMTLPINVLEKILQDFVKLTKISNFRIHTRSLVYDPTIFTGELISVLAKYKVRLYMHISHPYELDNYNIKKTKLLIKAGVKIYNQFPLLRGINDHTLVLKKLLVLLDELGIRQVSIFTADPICFSADFRLPLKRIFSIIDEINWTTPSWVNCGRLVMDTPVGKVRRENIIKWNHLTKKVIFEREGKKIIYHDFPEKLYKAGDINLLLWKDER